MFILYVTSAGVTVSTDVSSSGQCDYLDVVMYILYVTSVTVSADVSGSGYCDYRGVHFVCCEC